MAETRLTTHSRFLLLDANIVAGYYLPEALSVVTARPRITDIIEAVRNGAAPEMFLYIPRLCVPEVLVVFAKYFLARWDKTVQKSLPRRLTKSRYQKILQRFHNDLESERLLNQVEVTPYHIAATRLITPVDAYYKYYRRRNKKRARRHKKMMGAADHTIIGMGIALSRIHGRDHFSILTADRRLADILTRATGVKRTTAEKLGLIETAEKLGLEYHRDLYPRVMNLGTATKPELRGFFGAWPLPKKLTTTKPIVKVSASDCDLLAKLRERSGIGRDSLPYTSDFESICREFERLKGQAIDRHAAWMAIGRIEKKGKAKRKTT